MVTFLISIALAASNPDADIVIDCSTWMGSGKLDLAFEFTTRDGKTIKDLITVFPDTDGSIPILGFMLVLRHHKWRYEVIEPDKILIRGSKDSRIQSVRFDSKGWRPTFYYYTEVAPPPRPVHRK